MGFDRKLYVILPFLVFFSGSAAASSVYFTDGSMLECESFRRTTDQVVVKVNRDVVVAFEKSEVDLARTFPVKKKKKAHGTRRVVAKKAAAIVASPSQAGSPPAASIPKVAIPAAPSPIKPAAVGTAPSTAPMRPVQAAPAAVPSPEKLTPDPVGKNPAAQAEAAKPGSLLPPHNPELMNKLAQRQKATPTTASPAISGSTLLLLVGSILIILILFIAANYRIFLKAGQPGWKCLIPIYNLYILIKISGKPGWWLILMFIPLVGAVIYLLTLLSLAEKFGKGPLFGVGLFFLNIIFFPVLAFDGSTYESASASC